MYIEHASVEHGIHDVQGTRKIDKFNTYFTFLYESIDIHVIVVYVYKFNTFQKQFSSNDSIYMYSLYSHD